MKQLLVVIALCFSFNALADILFFNFNRNNSSIEAARKAAVKRGEKLIVYPNSKIKKITPTELQTIFSEVANQKITSIVMSGHDGGGHFAGKDGDISKIDLAKAMLIHPELSEGVKSLLLRGCYSATMSEVQSQSAADWRLIFPNLKYIAGYNDSAESSERAQSKEFVEDMLVLEEEFMQSTGVDKISKTFKKIGLYNQMNAAVWMKPCTECELNKEDSGIYLTSKLAKENKSAISIADERARCSEQVEVIIPHAKIIQNYFNGVEKGFERPPKEHQGTKLREAYAYFRQNEHCLAILIPEYAEAYNPDRVIRLIYFDYIVSNFQDYYPAAPITKMLEKNLPKEFIDQIKYPDLKTASRKEINDFISWLEAAAGTIAEGKAEGSSEYKVAIELLRHSQIMNVSLGSLMPFHVPFSWVSEPHARTPLTGITFE